MEGPPRDRGAPGARAEHAPVAAQQRGPRIFDYSAVSQLSQDSTYREFREWLEMWTNNARVKQFTAFDRETQVYAIVSAAGPHASRVLRTHLGIDLDSQRTTAETVLQGLQKYYRDQRSVVVDRVAFRNCKQRSGEMFDEFRFRLTDMADDADLCTHCRDTQLVTQMIYGLKNEKAKNELLQKRDFPTLEDTVQLCRAFEVADRNQAKLEGREVSRVSAYKQEKHQTQQQEASSRGRSTTQSEPEECSRCGLCHKIPTYCPAANAECRNCHKKGHWARVCKSPSQPDNKSNQSRTQSQPDNMVGMIKSVYVAPMPHPKPASDTEDMPPAHPTPKQDFGSPAASHPATRIAHISHIRPPDPVSKSPSASKTATTASEGEKPAYQKHAQGVIDNRNTNPTSVSTSEKSRERLTRTSGALKAKKNRNQRGLPFTFPVGSMIK